MQSSSEELERLISAELKNMRDFEDLVRIHEQYYPAGEEQIFNFIIQPEKFTQYVQTPRQLQSLVAHFKEERQQREIFNFIMQPKIFTQYVQTPGQLQYLVKHFKEESQQGVIFWNFNDSEVFKKLVNSNTALNLVTSLFPEAKESLEKAYDHLIFIRANSSESIAFTKKATAVGLKKVLDQDSGEYVGSFLDRRCGAKVAQTNKASYQAAKEGEAAAKEGEANAKSNAINPKG